MNPVIDRPELRDAIAALFREMSTPHCWPEPVLAATEKQIASELLERFDIRASGVPQPEGEKP